MSSYIKYHFCKSSFVLNLIDGLTKDGVHVQNLIHKTSLRFFRLDNPEAMLPIPVMYEFLELVHQYLGLTSISELYYKYYCLEKVGAYGMMLANSKKVLPTITNSVKYGKSSISSANIKFRILDNCSALYHVHYETAPCKAQYFMNDIDLSMQLDLVLDANEAGWSPNEIHLIGSNTSMIENKLPNFKGKIKTNQNKFGLVIDLNTLTRPLASNPKKIDCKESLVNVPNTLPGKIETLFDTFADSYLPGIKEVSKMFNSSESSFKRQLAKHGVSFYTLLNNWRFTKAVELLTNTSLKINEISDRLYYANTANFDRAFKHWSGLRPKDFR